MEKVWLTIVFVSVDGTHSKYITTIPSTQDGNNGAQQENDAESQEYLVHGSIVVFDHSIRIVIKLFSFVFLSDINEVLIQEIAKRPQIYDSRLCTKNKSQIRRDLW